MKAMASIAGRMAISTEDNTTKANAKDLVSLR